MASPNADAAVTLEWTSDMTMTRFAKGRAR